MIVREASCPFDEEVIPETSQPILELLTFLKTPLVINYPGNQEKREY